MYERKKLACAYEPLMTQQMPICCRSLQSPEKTHLFLVARSHFSKNIVCFQSGQLVALNYFVDFVMFYVVIFYEVMSLH